MLAPPYDGKPNPPKTFAQQRVRSCDMKNLLLSGLLATVIATPVLAALPEGAAAPDFEAQASLAGKTFTYRLQDALKKGTTVIYFYPSAYTGGCNIQAHTFSENADKFTA